MTAQELKQEIKTGKKIMMYVSYGDHNSIYMQLDKKGFLETIDHIEVSRLVVTLSDACIYLK
jgi:hypothetical protein